MQTSVRMRTLYVEVYYCENSHKKSVSDLKLHLIS